MTLHDLVRRLGGDLYAGGRRASIPAPGHSRADRSVSLLLSGRRLVIHSFGSASWRDIRSELMRLGLIDADGRLADPGSASAPAFGVDEPPGRATRRRIARDLWSQAAAFGADSPAGLHCLARAAPNALERPWALRFAPFAPTSVYRPGATARPALLCAVQDADGGLTAVELNYLTEWGAATSWLKTPRKAVGVLPSGCAVRLSPAAPEMLVGEGVFTTLSAMTRFGVPGWALLSTRNLRRWTPPPGVGRVLVAADRGADGESSAEYLAERLRRRAVEVVIRPPPPPFGDWNDWARFEAEREEKEGRGVARRGAGRVPPGAGARPL